MRHELLGDLRPRSELEVAQFKVREIGISRFAVIYVYCHIYICCVCVCVCVLYCAKARDVHLEPLRLLGLRDKCSAERERLCPDLNIMIFFKSKQCISATALQLSTQTECGGVCVCKTIRRKSHEIEASS